MNHSFEYITTLQYRLKAANAEIDSFKSGRKYLRMQEEHQKEVRDLEHKIRQLKEEIFHVRREMASARNQWFEVFEDIRKECEQNTSAAEKEKERWKKRALKAEQQRDAALDKVDGQRKRLYEVETELEEEKGKNLRLRAQINRDYENSSIPSSKSVKNKEIPNSREKTGRKQGAQPGHQGHGRKRQIPTSKPVLLEAPQEVIDDPDFKKTSKTIVKQLVGIRLLLDVTEYHADVYYNSKTGERVHAPFPAGVINEVNYDGSIKAFLFLLNNECCTSIEKSRRFLSDLTDGQLNISRGMINKLSREFAEKSEGERKALFADMLLSPIMHTDCTNAKVNGKSAYVFICATPDGKALYFAREKKGHEGVKKTVVEEYQGILVHDHESTFFNYGSDHQECLAHVLRYLKDSIDNEPKLVWNKEMQTLLRELIHERKQLPSGTNFCEKQISQYEAQYKNIIAKAKEEYEYIPPNKYYKDGYNLYLRMEKYMSSHLLFLHDYRIPTTNNEAERLLRGYKRKQVQAVSFRSQASIDYLCECMSMLVMMRKTEEQNIFQQVTTTFG